LHSRSRRHHPRGYTWCPPARDPSPDDAGTPRDDGAWQNDPQWAGRRVSTAELTARQAIEQRGPATFSRGALLSITSTNGQEERGGGNQQPEGTELCAFEPGGFVIATEQHEDDGCRPEGDDLQRLEEQFQGMPS